MSGVNARGWLVQVLNPTDRHLYNVAVASAEPIDAQAAAEIAKARTRKVLEKPSSFTLYTFDIVPAKVGTTIDSPKCSTEGCTNTGRRDGQCGKCFHAAKHADTDA